DGAFDGLGAGVAERDAAWDIAWRDGGEFFGEGDELLVVEVGARHMEEAGGLALYGFDHARVAVAGGDDGDAGGEIEEAIAVGVFDHAAFAALDDEGGRAGVRGRQNARVA